MRKKFITTMTIAAVAMIAGACGSDASITKPDQVNVPGSYALANVDGQTLPFAVLDLGAYKISIASGSLRLNADSTYIWIVGLRVDDSGHVRFDADTDSGRWTTLNRALSMTSTAGNLARSGIVSNDGVTLQSSTRVMNYRK